MYREKKNIKGEQDLGKTAIIHIDSYKEGIMYGRSHHQKEEQ